MNVFKVTFGRIIDPHDACQRDPLGMNAVIVGGYATIDLYYNKIETLDWVITPIVSDAV